MVGNAQNWLSFFPDSAVAICSVSAEDSACSEIGLTINLARRYPNEFYNLSKWYSDSVGYGNSSYMRSLKSDLRKLEPLCLLQVDENLSRFSDEHARDLGRKGKTGHRSSRGKSYNTRVEALLNNYSAVGEVCFYGDLPGWAMIVELVIDQGVRSLGHRENILNPEFRLMGIATAEHKVYGNSCVVEFAQ